MKRIAIIGGGFYGHFAASILQKTCAVDIYDDGGFMGPECASMNAQSRVHSGLFYARSLADLRACVSNLPLFCKMYRKALFKVQADYYVHSHSATTAPEYRALLASEGVRTRELPVPAVCRNIAAILRTTEYAIRRDDLRDIMLGALGGRVTRYATHIYDPRLMAPHADAYVLCAYGGTNGVRKALGLPELPIEKKTMVYWRARCAVKLPRRSWAVVDGDFVNATPAGDGELLISSKYSSLPVSGWPLTLAMMTDLIPEAAALLDGADVKPVIVTKALYKGDRLAHVFQDALPDGRPVYTIHSGKLTNAFSIVDDIRRIAD